MLYLTSFAISDDLHLIWTKYIRITLKKYYKNRGTLKHLADMEDLLKPDTPFS